MEPHPSCTLHRSCEWEGEVQVEIRRGWKGPREAGQGWQGQGIRVEARVGGVITRKNKKRRATAYARMQGGGGRPDQET